MADFEILHRGRDANGNYVYEIRKDGARVAELTHNHRGEDHYIRRPSLGAWQEFGNILTGGGPEPLSVSAAGRDALTQYLDDNPVT